MYVRWGRGPTSTCVRSSTAQSHARAGCGMRGQAKASPGSNQKSRRAGNTTQDRKGTLFLTRAIQCCTALYCTVNRFRHSIESKIRIRAPTRLSTGQSKDQRPSPPSAPPLLTSCPAPIQIQNQSHFQTPSQARQSKQWGPPPPPPPPDLTSLFSRGDPRQPYGTEPNRTGSAQHSTAQHSASIAKQGILTCRVQDQR